MKIGIPKEILFNESRVAGTPDILSKLTKKGFDIQVESGAGALAGFTDQNYEAIDHISICNTETVFQSDIIFKVHPPTEDEILKMKKGSVLISFLEPHQNTNLLTKLAECGVNALSIELLPRTSRAQSMDVLSSQANIAGYRGVIEACAQYKRYFPMMMTSAGSAKPAKVIVLGAGVAGLQAIATAKRLGASVEAYDIRPEVKEEIESLGAKFIDIQLEEEGSGEGGYAKELSEEAKKKQQELLSQKLMKADVIITTANIPGRKAPVLVPEDVLDQMREGSVIVDLAAATGGNCPLTEKDQVVVKKGVTLVGYTNYPAMLPSDASNFISRNYMNLLGLLTKKENDNVSMEFNLEDDIIDATLVTHQNEVRFQKK